jgi:hypothetical protein
MDVNGKAGKVSISHPYPGRNLVLERQGGIG